MVGLLYLKFFDCFVYVSLCGVVSKVQDLQSEGPEIDPESGRAYCVFFGIFCGFVISQIFIRFLGLGMSGFVVFLYSQLACLACGLGA